MANALKGITPKLLNGFVEITISTTNALICLKLYININDEMSDMLKCIVFFSIRAIF